MRSGRILLIVGVIGVVIAVIVGVVLIARSLTAKPAPTPPTGEEEGTPVTGAPAGMREIVIVVQDKIPRGHLITEKEGAVKLALWPEEAVPDDALFELESAYGRIARVDIMKNMPVTEGMLTEDAGDLAATGSDAALLIPSGRVGYALAVAGNASVAWAIQPGDHVDVLISLLVVDIDEDFQSETPNIGAAITAEEVGAAGPMGRLEVLPDGTLVMVVPGEAQRPRLVTQLTVQNAQVLRIGSWTEQEVVTPTEQTTEEAKPTVNPQWQLVKWVTLAVTPQEAAVLKYAEEVGASIDFVLRSADDHDERAVFTIQAVTLDYIFTRYSIEAPPKLPYGVTPPVEGVRPGATGEVGLEEGTYLEYSRLGIVTKTKVTTPE